MLSSRLMSLFKLHGRSFDTVYARIDMDCVTCVPLRAYIRHVWGWDILLLNKHGVDISSSLVEEGGLLCLYPYYFGGVKFSSFWSSPLPISLVDLCHLFTFSCTLDLEVKIPPAKFRRCYCANEGKAGQNSVGKTS